jgi:hypothetical protein
MALPTGPSYSTYALTSEIVYKTTTASNTGLFLGSAADVITESTVKELTTSTVIKSSTDMNDMSKTVTNPTLYPFITTASTDGIANANPSTIQHVWSMS